MIDITMRGNNKNQQSGFVAIIVTMIIMVVLILITTGFMRIIGREQRQDLDRQLSSQAFYAAETGINNAARALTDPATPLMVDKNECGPSSTPPLSLHFPAGSNVVDASSGIEYTCLTIDRTPRSLEYSALGK